MVSTKETFAGVTRVAGVWFALLLARRRAPLFVIILGAAIMTALLRFAGVT